MNNDRAARNHTNNTPLGVASSAPAKLSSMGCRKHGGRTDNRVHEESKPLARQRASLSSKKATYLRTLVAEFCSLPHRIRIGRQCYWDTSKGSPSVPEFLATEFALLRGVHKHKHAYSWDMRQLRERYPFLTDFDMHIARQAWNLGTRLVLYTSGTEPDPTKS
jgi:hypothetical protein